MRYSKALAKENSIIKKQVKQLEKKNSNTLHQIQSLSGKLRHNKEISELKANEFLHCNNSKFYTLSILADESTRGSAKVFLICFMYWNEIKNLPDMLLVKMKDLITCDAKTIAQIIIDTCNKYSIDTRIYQTFLSDNTNYMTRKNNDIAFGKLTITIGFSKQSHLFNLLYLAWELHNEYDKTNKDKPLGMKAEIIYDIYKTLLNFDMNQYQKLMQSYWLYELKTAIQFLEYIQIKCLVKFEKEFYKPMSPPGHRAHQMPETVLRWIKDLKFIAENIHDFFIEELMEVTKVLTEQQIEKLIGDLELAAEKSLEVFQKWMNCWLHLPLSICRLGGSYGHEFAKAYANVVLDLYGSN
ncbi:9572_t:CDS:2, partial [Funneliformis caledonium]